MLSELEIKAIKQIRNSIMQKGYSPTVRELMNFMGYNSPRSAAMVIDKLIKKGFLKRKPDNSLQILKNNEEDNSRADTIEVPLIGAVACGSPVLAQENFETAIPVSIKIAKPPYKYFFLKAKGDSMDEVNINNGDFVLVKMQSTAKEGDIVVALIDDEATIKEYHSYDDHVILKPRSKNTKNKPIILTKDFQVQGIVVKAMNKDSIGKYF
ncbi:MAG: repressor LexA [Elusimicrobia bacterium RIFOXYA2_FULL_39_19]|nr:MAG: repressor LexA [Elusimicrobia bacterium RIFOXYA2_FULL_39_19]